MNYELTTLWRTICREGVSPALGKIGMYFSQLIRAGRFMASRQQSCGSTTELVDAAWHTSRGLFRPGQVRSEIMALCELIASRQNKTVLEIGTANGGTFFLWCKSSAPDAELISVDLPGGVHGGGYPYWRTFLYRSFAQPGQRIHLLRGSSHDRRTFDAVGSKLQGRKLDFLFIDGDHTYDGVKRDFDIYSPLVKKGGIIAFHDICTHPPEIGCEVDRFWANIKQGYDHVEFVENAAQGWGGIGVLFTKQHSRSIT